MVVSPCERAATSATSLLLLGLLSASAQNTPADDVDVSATLGIPKLTGVPASAPRFALAEVPQSTGTFTTAADLTALEFEAIVAALQALQNNVTQPTATNTAALGSILNSIIGSLNGTTQPADATQPVDLGSALGLVAAMGTAGGLAGAGLGSALDAVLALGGIGAAIGTAIGGAALGLASAPAAIAGVVGLALLVAFLSTAGYYDGVGVVTSVPEPPVLALQARPPPFFAADQQTAPLVPIVLARNQV